MRKNKFSIKINTMLYTFVLAAAFACGSSGSSDGSGSDDEIVFMGREVCVR